MGCPARMATRHTTSHTSLSAQPFRPASPRLGRLPLRVPRGVLPSRLSLRTREHAHKQMAKIKAEAKAAKVAAAAAAKKAAAKAKAAKLTGKLARKHAKKAAKPVNAKPPEWQGN